MRDRTVDKQFANVAEAWPVYDTLCVTPQFYGQESIELGWFNTFGDFASKETHSFFMNRTAGNLGQAYTNKQTVDRVDFAYDAITLGVAFFAPGVRTLGQLVGGALHYRDNMTAHWWESELPRHCAIQFKVQEDIVSEGPAMLYSPGYGPTGGGASFNHEEVDPVAPNGAANAFYPPVMNWSMTQGVPDLSNRFQFPNTIEIPRTGSIEVILHLSEFARTMLQEFGGTIGSGTGPLNYVFTENVADATVEYSEFPSRYGIQVSLTGIRYVQQRAQYHV